LFLMSKLYKKVTGVVLLSNPDKEQKQDTGGPYARRVKATE
jgi:hypothetical protein